MLCPDIANNNKGAVLRAAVSRALKSPPWACFLACEAGLSGQLAGGKGSGFLCLSHSHSSHFLGSQSSEKPWPNSPCPHWEAVSEAGVLSEHLWGWGWEAAPPLCAPPPNRARELMLSSGSLPAPQAGPLIPMWRWREFWGSH